MTFVPLVRYASVMLIACAACGDAGLDANVDGAVDAAASGPCGSRIW